MQKVRITASSYEAHRAAGGTTREWIDSGYSAEQMPVMAGGAQNPAWHPFAPPTVSADKITVSMFLQNPTRVTRYVRDITLERFLIDRLFTSAGGVSGGAVIYDVIQKNDLYPDRDIGLVSPGAEFPVVTSSEVFPSVALTEKWGAKAFISDEAVRRNDSTRYMNELRRLGNAIVRKENQRAQGIVAAAVTANSRTSAGHSWSAAILYGTTPTAPSATPNADLALAQKTAIIEEMGVQFDTILWHPTDAMNFRNVYQGQYQQVLADNGITEAYASPRVTAGSPYLIQSGQLGELRLEKPLSTEIIPDREHQLTWTQSDVWPVMYVVNPFAILQLTGVA